MLNARKVLFLGAALVLGSALSASAADLGGLKDEPEMAPAPTGPSGWYARVDGGYAWYNKPGVSVEGFTTHDTDMGSAWSIGGGIGRYFCCGSDASRSPHFFDSTRRISPNRVSFS